MKNLKILCKALNDFQSLMFYCKFKVGFKLSKFKSKLNFDTQVNFTWGDVCWRNYFFFNFSSPLTGKRAESQIKINNLSLWTKSKIVAIASSAKYSLGQH